MKKIILTILISTISLSSLAGIFHATIPQPDRITNGDFDGDGVLDINDSTPFGGPDGSSATPVIPAVDGVTITDGWYVIVDNYVSLNATISDLAWSEIKANMTVGIKIIKSNDEEIIIPKSTLEAANCLNLSDITTINSDNMPERAGKIALYHDETTGCSIGGSDYSYIGVGSEILITNYTGNLISGESTSFYDYYKSLMIQ